MIVPELRAEVRLHRDAREVLDHPLAHQAGVIRGAAAEQEHAAHLPGAHLEPVQEGVPLLRGETAPQGVRDRPGLLVDLL